MNDYHKMIVEDTGCIPEDAEEIEDIMRHSIFHSTLDWQSRQVFRNGAKEAAEVLKALRKEDLYYKSVL